MYVRRIQLLNYGPIDHLDMELPFEEDLPKPVLLIGENGTGKSILLSHIVNGLISAKDRVYPNSPEMEPGKVYKLRSSSYIKLGKEAYFSRVDFEDDLYISEIRSQSNKVADQALPPDLQGADISEAWDGMTVGNNDHTINTFRPNNVQRIRTLFFENSVLYFPPNRFEEPAWLNQENLTFRAEYMGIKNISGQTERRIMNYAPLRDNQNWLFEVVYDRAAFETQTANVNFGGQDGPLVQLPVLLGYSGEASSSYETAIEVVRNVLPGIPNVRFGIGRRRDRVVSIMAGDEVAVQNIFQMSTGETSLLNLFLSILRDYELCGAQFSSTIDVRGIVVVDEIDLHLHVSHQYSILPNLIKLFPKVQFIVTTHSPLFILGMKNAFGEDGFALYRMPRGDEIDPEDFGEFEGAYQAFADTRKHVQEIRDAQANVYEPIVFVEGEFDQRYIAKSAELLGKEATLNKIRLRQDGGSSGLDKIWNAPELSGTLPVSVGLLYDCDTGRPDESKGRFSRRTLPIQETHPVKRGIENLFSRETLEKALAHKSAFIDITEAHSETVRGEHKEVPETWAVNKDEKKNLCDWLCENGTVADFQSFEIVFDMIEAMINEFEEATECPGQ